MTFEEITSRFTKSGPGYLCPAHDDQNASLSISHGHNGGTVLHCHAGCATEDVLNEAGLTIADLMPDSSTPSPARPKASFWTPERKAAVRAAAGRLKSEPDHELVRIAAERDGIDFDALVHFGCGIISDREVQALQRWRDNGRDWLVFPYTTGAQLYRREGGEKVVFALTGSDPRGSFFGAHQLNGAAHLAIAKSPREAMLLSAFDIGVLGLPGGEKGELSVSQSAFLRERSAGLESVRVLMDCDTEQAQEVARAFTSSVAEAVNPVPVALVNITEWSKGAAKDVTDVAKSRGLQAIIDALAYVEPHADPEQPQEAESGLSVEDFWSLAPENRCIFAPSGELWSNASVNARLKAVPTGEAKSDGTDEYVSPTAYLARYRSVEQLSWLPGDPQIIEGILMTSGGRIRKPGCRIFNLYKPPTIIPGNAEEAAPWIEHLRWIFPDEADHIIAWFAHKVQRPGVKINHALVLGGAPGIGKDASVEPLRRAIGEQNFEDVTPAQLLGRFNSFVKSVVLRVSEARDLGDVDRFGFYEHLKIYTAAPPEMLRCDEKNRQEYYVPNVTGVILTTNHKTGGIYLPPDDRRHFVAWSERSKDSFPENYWSDLWGWYEREGYRHVAAYLQTYDLSGFDPKAPPRKTPAFWEIVDANRSPEDAELADALDRIASEWGQSEWPAAVTVSMVAKASASGDFTSWLNDRRSSRQIPHRFEAAGYVKVRNDAAQDGLWKVGGKRQAVYARKTDSPRDRVEAALQLSRNDLSVPF